MKRTPLNKVSKKRKALNVERSAFVREQLSKRWLCEVGVDSICLGYATELHEPLTRARAPGAETILSVENSVAICRMCHVWVHANIAEATKRGWLKPSKEKTT